MSPRDKTCSDFVSNSLIAPKVELKVGIPPPADLGRTGLVYGATGGIIITEQLPLFTKPLMKPSNSASLASGKLRCAV